MGWSNVSTSKQHAPPLCLRGVHAVNRRGIELEAKHLQLSVVTIRRLSALRINPQHQSSIRLHVDDVISFESPARQSNLIRTEAFRLTDDDVLSTMLSSD